MSDQPLGRTGLMQLDEIASLPPPDFAVVVVNVERQEGDRHAITGHQFDPAEPQNFPEAALLFQQWHGKLKRLSLAMSAPCPCACPWEVPLAMVTPEDPPHQFRITLEAFHQAGAHQRLLMAARLVATSREFRDLPGVARQEWLRLAQWPGDDKADYRQKRAQFQRNHLYMRLALASLRIIILKGQQAAPPPKTLGTSPLAKVHQQLKALKGYQGPAAGQQIFQKMSPEDRLLTLLRLVPTEATERN